MAVASSLQQQCEVQNDRYPLLMERPASASSDHHVIDIARGGAASPSRSHGDAHAHAHDSAHVPVEHQSSLSPIASISRNSSFTMRDDDSGRRHRSPLNSGLWISIELVVNLSQIMASAVVLSISQNEHPQAPLFAWIVGYMSGCIAILPHLYWRYVHRNYQGSEQGTSHLRHSSSQDDLPEPASYSAVSVTPALEREHNNTPAAPRFGRNSVNTSPRLKAFVDHLKMALDCFFAVWFVVGNVWVFGGHSSAADAPNLYRLCIVFLTFSCIGYAMPFILCGMICCCLPCIISIMGFREDRGPNRGATSESINALPTYKFKSKGSVNGEESDLDDPGEGGILAAGTDKERAIPAEDAVCCICLAVYANNDDLRELPCAHVFHVECVDKWLKINASCPLCKSEVGSIAGSESGSNPGRRQSDRRVGSGVESEQEQVLR
ncbi:E3 ubiquitin-protein ligase-like [Iris pallida]|uniref:E3 ubiquitin-protein ligase-like n=1 Tax=Iris pallida TaxID=29817 RepID=A0AAX6HV74_IRIPA|nr:E3 ubiquitin-protein ligase-like [Iris pallida]